MLCKETAVVTPVIFLGVDLLIEKKVHKRILVAGIIAGIYLLLHKFTYGFLSGSDYTISLNPIKVANNLLWYFLWSTGFPESFVNTKLFSVPTVINPALLTSYGAMGKGIALFVLAFLGYLVVCFSIWFKGEKRKSLALFAVLIFLTYLGPVALFQFHKFPYSLGTPLIGFSILLATILSKLNRRLLFLGILSYVIIFVSVTDFNLENHWSRKRALLAQEVITYLTANKENFTSSVNLYFRENNQERCDPVKKFYSSSEVSYALSGANAIQLVFSNQNLVVYYEGIDNNKHLSLNSYTINSEQFMH